MSSNIKALDFRFKKTVLEIEKHGNMPANERMRCKCEKCKKWHGAKIMEHGKKIAQGTGLRAQINSVMPLGFSIPAVGWK